MQLTPHLTSLLPKNQSNPSVDVTLFTKHTNYSVSISKLRRETTCGCTLRPCFNHDAIKIIALRVLNHVRNNRSNLCQRCSPIARSSSKYARVNPPSRTNGTSRTRCGWIQSSTWMRSVADSWRGSRSAALMQRRQ